jgi:PAS domain S-box-containing protein
MCPSRSNRLNWLPWSQASLGESQIATEQSLEFLMTTAPVDQTTFRRMLTRAIVLPLILMSTLTGVLLWQISHLLSVTQWVDHADRVIAQAQHTQKLLLDMETGLRGYLITGYQDFLEPYKDAAALIGSSFETLSRLISNNPPQLRRLEELRSYYAQWSRFAKDVMALRDRGGDYQAYIRSRQDKKLMDAMRAQFDSFISLEENLRYSRSQALVRATRIVLGTAIGLTVLLGGLLALSARRQLMALSQSYARTLRVAQDRTEALRKSEKRFQLVARATNDAIWDWDLLSNDLWWNEGVRILFGYSPEQAGPDIRWWHEHLHPEDKERVISGIHAVIDGGEQFWSSEYRFLRADRSYAHVLDRGYVMRDEGGKPVRMIGAMMDITERQRTEDELRRYAKRLEVLHETDRSILQSQSPANIAQAALNSIRQLIPCRLLNVTLFDFARRRAVVIADPFDGNASSVGRESFALEQFRDIERLERGETLLVEDRRKHPRPDFGNHQFFTGDIRVVSNVPLISQGQLIGSLNLGDKEANALSPENIEIAREVADLLAIAIQQSRLSEELQRHSEQLEQLVNRRTQQLQEVNRELEAFAYSVSHDLRAPLRGMQGFAQALLEDYGDHLDSAGQDYARRIIEAARRMDTLIRDLLAYSRLSRTDVQLQPVSLTSVLAAVQAELEPEIRERAARVAIEKPLPEVQGDYTTLFRVVTNLFTNAFKFVAPGVQPQVRVWAEERGEWVRLWVEDNGIGIAAEHQERIFDVFQRLHSNETYPGTGIGLAIVRKGVERMGGNVGVDPEAGQGSRFWVELRKA